MKRRIFTEVLDQIIAVVPADEPLYADLDAIRRDIFCIFPEDENRWWRRLQDTLQRHILPGRLNEWQHKVSAVVRGGTVVELSATFQCEHCGEAHEGLQCIQRDVDGETIIEAGCPRTGKLITASGTSVAANAKTPLSEFKPGDRVSLKLSNGEEWIAEVLGIDGGRLVVTTNPNVPKYINVEACSRCRRIETKPLATPVKCEHCGDTHGVLEVFRYQGTGGEMVVEYRCPRTDGMVKLPLEAERC